MKRPRTLDDVRKFRLLARKAAKLGQRAAAARARSRLSRSRSDDEGRGSAPDRQRPHANTCFLEDDDRACLQRLRDRVQVREEERELLLGTPFGTGLNRTSEGLAAV